MKKKKKWENERQRRKRKLLRILRGKPMSTPSLYLAVLGEHCFIVPVVIP
jgi:hypothetical protein